MKKEEILEKSRKENEGKLDELGMKHIADAGKIGMVRWSIAVCVVCGSCGNFQYSNYWSFSLEHIFCNDGKQ